MAVGQPTAGRKASRDVQPILSEISRRRKLSLFLRHLRPGDSVLEVGAGAGWFARQLRDRGWRVTTLDVTPPADIVGDINQWESLGIRPSSFDAVVALELIEHVDCLHALAAVCKPGGLIMLSSPHPDFDWLMVILERLHLTQKRTSPHVHLTDLAAIPLPRVVLRRPLLIHQVAIFRNAGPRRVSKQNDQFQRRSF